MGLDDPEDIIPGIIILFAIMGFLGGLVTYVPSLGDIPVLSSINGFINSLFMMLASMITPYIGLSAGVMALIIEALVVIIAIVIIVKVGY